ncbi:FAD/NAD(P)-binding protein [Sphingobium boeckii]|uniref:Cation diffusion facilitator CzcD-associated flavoprotein CzcO n=1 Tax=Sphingobium boeckii TaxID=1082345 RepID=A0A7W9AHC4_9SPHN|nr:NAD(P)/FAD-dependent oxidoreductase [Sphingobium boeckii]MBB5685705.1 cation diffusion facilitator CzcD-associated flavoprotein CzcO [Sphingobium boeckii]
MTLAQHAARVAHDLECLGYGAPSWTRSRPLGGDHVHDVVIVGGGQSGLGAAFGLLRERISNILVLDENPEGMEGPWKTYARMITLRTPKHLTSIDYGIPSLTFRAYWEAMHGAEGWAALDKIPRGEWFDYLRWYRRVLDIPVRNNAKVISIAPVHPGLFRLMLADRSTILARKVVLATGIQGGGQWHVPAMISAKLPRLRYAHTSEAIDFAALKGKRIAILGGGASAFDNAQHALSEAAGEVHVFVRRKALPTVNPIRFMEGAGLISRFPALDDTVKYRMMKSFFARNQPPTNDTFARAASYPGFRLHLGTPWLDVEDGPTGAIVTTPKGRETFDFLILSTGLVTDPALRPELSLFAERIALWRDRHNASDDERDLVVDAHPYLGAGFEFLPKTPADAEALYGLFAFNYSGLINFGLSASAISGLKQALPRLVSGVADQLFVDDHAEIVADYLAYAEPEFTGISANEAAAA